MDLAMQWRNGYGYLFMDGSDLAGEDGLRSAVLVSLFTDRRAGDKDQPPDGGTDRRGHWSDSHLPGNDLEGSRLWLLEREKILPEVLRRAEDYSREALAWMLADGAASAVQVTAWSTGRGGSKLGDLNLRIALSQPDRSTVTFEFFDVWKKEAPHGV